MALITMALTTEPHLTAQWLFIPYMALTTEAVRSVRGFRFIFSCFMALFKNFAKSYWNGFFYCIILLNFSCFFTDLGGSVVI